MPAQPETRQFEQPWDEGIPGQIRQYRRIASTEVCLLGEQCSSDEIRRASLGPEPSFSHVERHFGRQRRNHSSFGHFYVGSVPEPLADAMVASASANRTFGGSLQSGCGGRPDRIEQKVAPCICEEPLGNRRIVYRKRRRAHYPRAGLSVRSIAPGRRRVNRRFPDGRARPDGRTPNTPSRGLQC
jgi:hypothetical protein